MREIGSVKWFGGFNPKLHKLIDYGYIEREGKPEIYVNKNHLHCRVKALEPGTVVTFEIGLNYKNGMEQALKVKLLKNEKEEELVKSCAYSDKKEYFIPVIAGYINSASESDYLMLIPKILSLAAEEQRCIVKDLSTEIKMKREVYNILTEEEKAETIFELKEEGIINYWNTLEHNVKILLLYKLCSENRDLSIVEKLSERNIAIRALLIIAWVKNNQDKKEVAYKKAFELISKYYEKIKDGQYKKEEIRYLLPEDKNYEVNIKKEWQKWTILEILRCCDNDNIITEYNRDNDVIIKLERLIKNGTDLKNAATN